MTYVRCAAIGVLAAAMATGCSKKESKGTMDQASKPLNAGETAAPEGGTGSGVRGGAGDETDEDPTLEGEGHEDDGDGDEDEDTY